jgi:hypothetical protein
MDEIEGIEVMEFKPASKQVLTFEESMLVELDDMNNARLMTKSKIERFEEIVVNYEKSDSKEQRVVWLDSYTNVKSKIIDLKAHIYKLENESKQTHPILYEKSLSGNKHHFRMLEVFVQIIKLVKLKFGDLWYDIITFSFDMGQMYWYARMGDFPINKYIPYHTPRMMPYKTNAMPDFNFIRFNQNPHLTQFIIGRFS